VLNTLWEDEIPGELKEALVDVNDRDEAKAEEALFNKLVEENKRNAKELVDAAMGNIVRSIREDENKLSGMREIVHLSVIIVKMESRIEDKEEELKAEWDKADREQLAMIKSSLAEKIVLKAMLEEKREERLKEFIDTQIFAGNPDLAEAVYDIHGRNKAKAKAELFKTIVERNKEESQKVVNKNLNKKTEELLADGKIVANLREAVEKKNSGIVLNTLWEDEIPGELKEALVDVNDRDEPKAKEALFNELVKINKRHVEELVSKSMGAIFKSVREDKIKLAKLREIVLLQTVIAWMGEPIGRDGQ